MSEICSCGTPGGKGTAYPSCAELINRVIRPNFFPTFDTDGNRNYIDATSALDDTYFDGLQFNADKSQRLYPVPLDMKNVQHPRTDTRYKTYSDDSKVRLGPGTRSFEALFPAMSNKFISGLNSGACGSWSVIFTDADGKPIGWNGGDKTNKTKLYGLPLAKQTVDAFMTWANDENPQEGNIRWDFDRIVKDEDWSWINKSLLDYDLFNLSGIFDVTMSESAKTATTLKVSIQDGFGGIGDTTQVTGLVATDFVLTNTTDSATVSKTLAEGADGYTFTFLAQGSAEAYSLSLSKQGLEAEVLTGTFAV